VTTAVVAHDWIGVERVAKPNVLIFERGSQPPIIEARIAPFEFEGDLVGYRVQCGRCGSPLGWLLAPSFNHTGAWILDHEDGYRGSAESGYHVLHTTERRERSYFNPETGVRGPRGGKEQLDLSRLEETKRLWKYASVAPESTLGVQPELPCIVHCPRSRCQETKNRIDIPKHVPHVI
jgi:hypothetical protein